MFLIVLKPSVTMEKLSTGTRVLAVTIQYKCSKCFAETHWKLRTWLGFHNAPNVTMIRRIIDRFEESNAVEVRRSIGCTKREDATITVVRDCEP